MTAVNKIDSNDSALRYAEEASIGTLSGSPVWYALEPNTYKSFGGKYKNTNRKPINGDRQNRRGEIVDLDAMADFDHDLTYNGLQDLMQGFFFAALRKKTELFPTAVSGTLYTVPSGGTGFAANSLLFASGFAITGNNGLKKVTASASTTVTAGGLAIETPPSTAKIVRVGVEGASGDIGLTNSGGVVTLTSTSLDFTTLGLIPGEWIYIGGDVTAEKFATAANNGFARVYSVSATAVVLDKTANTTVTDAGTGKTIRLFFGRVLKNETGTSIVRKSYQFERKLGAPDGGSPSDVQSEYVVGAVADQLTINVKQADKVTLDMTFKGTSYETRDASTGVKSGTRPTLVSGDMFNTSSDFSRIKMALVSSSQNPTALLGYFSDLTVKIDNGISPDKAVGTLGAFDMSSGNFNVSASVSGYFTDVAQISAIQNNSDVSIDFALVASNSGVLMDLPVLQFGGNGEVKIDADKPMTLPLAGNATLETTFNHTALMVFFDYLPSAAG